MRLAWGLALAGWLTAGCAAAQPGLEAYLVPVPGTDAAIAMRVCPEAGEPRPLVVINHGSPARAADRPRMQMTECGSEAVRWFTARGFTVALPLRRGYGASGGDWAEGFGRCQQADYAAAGRETARDILAAIAVARTLPMVRGDLPVIVVGQSAGGWGGLALAAMNPPGIAAIVNMAGGRGGWSEGVANTNCRPDLLASAAGQYGSSARVPTLWLYTENDSFFAPPIARSLHAAYTGGGGVAEYRPLPAFGEDGHRLFFGRGGSAVWGAEVAPWLAARLGRPLASGAAR
jgi:pimeloyl-ACP methyl ester carboxylesterase